jgi:hypothetical protein
MFVSTVGYLSQDKSMGPIFGERSYMKAATPAAFSISVDGRKVEGAAPPKSGTHLDTIL